MDDIGFSKTVEVEEETSKLPVKSTIVPIPHTSEAVEQGEQDGVTNEKKKTRNRKRKKALHSSIRAQMEFYFSDANLSKDRFMQGAIKNGQEVPLRVFMTFNRIKKITEDIQEIQKALEHSTVLKLSDDKLKVCRIIPFRPRSQDEEDLCTVYVEHLPVTADIDWVSNVFKEFGEVAYVSLPKYKDGKNKGFAFVEYKQADSAVEAVKAYSATSAYESLIQDPGLLCSIKAFNEDQGASNELNLVKEEPGKAIAQAEEEDDEEDQPQTKKLRLDESISTDTANKKKGNEDVKLNTKQLRLEQEEPIETGVETPDNTNDQAEQEQGEGAPSKKKRKKKKNKAPYQDSAALNYEAQILPLQVMSKKEWKKLRNKYLNMQRKCLRQLRITAFQNHSYHEHDYQCEKLQNGEVQNENHQDTEIKLEHGIEFDMGLIVKITLNEPIMDAKRFKSQVRSQDGVSYVEAQDGSNFAFVRCNDSAAAKSLVQKNIWDQTSILGGDEERVYWQKIEDNRIKKREKSTKQKKPGNRNNKKDNNDVSKLPSKAAQHKSLHIRFDDNTDEVVTMSNGTS